MAAASKCPVCGWEITGNGREVQIGTKTIMVCSDECAHAVKADPAKYAG